MSWLTGLAGKAEDFLNKVDKTAATALHAEDGDEATPTVKYVTQPDYYTAPRPSLATTKLKTSNLSTSASVPANLSRIQQVPQQRAPSNLSEPDKNGGKKKSDDELFEFLNNPTSGSPSGGAGNKKKSALNASNLLNGGHSRQSSGSSVVSGKGARTPEALEEEEADYVGDDSEELHSTAITMDDSNNSELLSGHHSNQGDGGVQQHLSSLELENQLLKNEVASLNQEMTSIIQRAKDSQKELSQLQQRRGGADQQLRQRDQQLRQLQAEVDDLQQAIAAKDGQMAVMRVRLEEVDKQLQLKTDTLQQIEADRNRILEDHTSVSGVHSQTLENMKEKLMEMEGALQREREANSRTERSTMQWQEQTGVEKQNLSNALTKAQKKINEQTAQIRDIDGHMRTSKSQFETMRQELQDYKEKATRILQSKDRLISSLKEGDGTGVAGVAGGGVELDAMRQERDLLRDELQQQRVGCGALEGQLRTLEAQTQQDAEDTRDQLSGLEEQLAAEEQRREESEADGGRQKTELRCVHEELLKQKTALSSRIQDRDMEIDRLRNQLTTKSLSSSSQVELESRLHALTESLILKQTMLESLGTEKNSLVLQLERMDKQCRESEAAAVRATSTRVILNDDDEVRQRLPGFMRASPQDSRVAQRVKRAADTIDRFSIRLGVFLRRYPIARIFVIVYMVMLHLWVMVVLLTYQPEIHNTRGMP